MAWTSRFITSTTRDPRPEKSWRFTTILNTLTSFLSKYDTTPNQVYHSNRWHHRVTPMNQDEMKHLIDTFNCVEDCPIFADMFEFCKLYAGASLAGARKLSVGTTDTAINWSGGLHHAKRSEANGFCYVNDAVLAILEMLK